MATARFESPVGMITVTADDTHLRGIRLGRFGELQPTIASNLPLLGEARAQICAWLAGDRTDFDLPLVALDTEEGARLREGIAAIAYGETLTYGALGNRIGTVARAVGQACKTNPFPIVIPCHRVVSAAGPEYYSGGSGPRTKTWLLDFEYAHLPQYRRTRLI